MAFRNPPAGTKDKGDITILGNHKITLEVKNHRTLDLATWTDEAMTEKVNARADFAAVAHKRLRRGNPGDWYVTLPVSEYLAMIKLL